MHWSIFCRVVDNYGDAGFCLRLARELRERGEAVQLFIDDSRPLAWMQQQDADPLQPLPWPADDEAPALGQVVIEAFGCALPAGVLAAIGRQRPLWINLEYLSAEDYVERSHSLPSPQLSGPAAGCVKHFCFPGFTPRTGGLLREQGLPAARAAHDSSAWLAAQGWACLPGERAVSLFAYPQAPLAALLQALADAPTQLFVLGGLALPPAPPQVRLRPLPWLSQAHYDRLLWSCQLNAVRGEDSLVRAHWAGKPLLWQLYPQDDAARGAKLDAWLARLGWPQALHAGLRAWNGLGPAEPLGPAVRQLLAQPALCPAVAPEPELVSTLVRWSRSGPERPS